MSQFFPLKISFVYFVLTLIVLTTRAKFLSYITGSWKFGRDSDYSFWNFETSAEKYLHEEAEFVVISGFQNDIPILVSEETEYHVTNSSVFIINVSFYSTRAMLEMDFAPTLLLTSNKDKIYHIPFTFSALQESHTRYDQTKFFRLIADLRRLHIRNVTVSKFSIYPFGTLSLKEDVGYIRLSAAELIKKPSILQIKGCLHQTKATNCPREGGVYINLIGMDMGVENQLTKLFINNHACMDLRIEELLDQVTGKSIISCKLPAYSYPDPLAAKVKVLNSYHPELYDEQQILDYAVRLKEPEIKNISITAHSIHLDVYEQATLPTTGFLIFIKAKYQEFGKNNWFAHELNQELEGYISYLQAKEFDYVDAKLYRKFSNLTLHGLDSDTDYMIRIARITEPLLKDADAISMHESVVIGHLSDVIDIKTKKSDVAIDFRQCSSECLNELSLTGDSWLFPVLQQNCETKNKLSCLPEPGRLELTPPDGDSAAAVTLRKTFSHLRHGFKAKFVFSMTNKSNICLINDERCITKGGDGLAFFIKQHGQLGEFNFNAVGSDFGLTGFTNIFAITFDNFYNYDKYDISDNFLAVWISFNKINTTILSESYVISQHLDIPLYDSEILVQVEYIPITSAKILSQLTLQNFKVDESLNNKLNTYKKPGILKVYVNQLDESSYNKSRPKLTTLIDLEPIIPTMSHNIGFSAATGKHFQQHSIHSISFSETRLTG